jgi:anionic cell wall polymer biosynthesis LytR-Cps2A-Psr (LCP) family protein
MREFAMLFFVILFSAVAFTTAYVVKHRNNPNDEATETTAYKSEAEWQLESQPVLHFGDRTYRYDHDILTYLFIGTDDSGNEFGTGTDYRGRMADFLLVATFDKTDKTYGFLQINRDTMTEVERIDNDGTELGPMEMQICVSHWYGTDEVSSSVITTQTVSDFLGGLHVDGYYTLHMSDVGKLNSLVGGVQITIDEDLTKIDPAMKPGATIVLDDMQAQRYVRARMDVGDGENTSRMKRQTVYLNAFMDQALAKLQEDPKFIDEMFDTFEDVAVTDISKKELSVIGQQMRTGENKGILQIEGETKIGQALGDGVDHTEFYADEKSKIRQMEKLYSLKVVQETKSKEKSKKKKRAEEATTEE